MRRLGGAIQSQCKLHPDGFNPLSVRTALLSRGGPIESGFVQYAYRPFDTRWLYWEGDTKLLDEKRAEYKPHVFEDNLWLSSVS